MKAALGRASPFNHKMHIVSRSVARSQRWREIFGQSMLPIKSMTPRQLAGRSVFDLDVEQLPRESFIMAARWLADQRNCSVESAMTQLTLDGMQFSVTDDLRVLGERVITPIVGAGAYG